MFRHPERVYDSIISVKFPKLSKENKAMHSLLYTMVMSRMGNPVENDSLIYESLNWFKRKSDHRNICRACLFYSVTVFRRLNFATDSLKSAYIFEAEKIFKEINLNDRVTEAFLYKNLALKSILIKDDKPRIQDYNMLLKAEELIERSNNIFYELNNSREAHNSLIIYAEIFSQVYDYDKRLEIYNRISKSDSIHPDIREKLYFKYHILYANNEEHSKSIYYLKKLIRESSTEDIPNRIKYYQSLCKVYQTLDEPDSALRYAILHNELTIKDINNAYYGYRLLSEVYEQNKDYLNALKYQKKYNQAIIKSSQIKNANLVLKNKSEKENLILENRAIKNNRKISFAVFSLIVLPLLIICIYQTFSVRKKIKGKDVEYNELLQKFQEKEIDLQKLWLGNELLKSNSEVNSEMIKSVIKEAVRCRKESRDISMNLNAIIENQKQMSKEIIPEITRVEQFSLLFTEINAKTELTPYEKIIQALYASGFDTKDIAHLFHTTSSNIRAVKSRIKS